MRRYAQCFLEVKGEGKFVYNGMSIPDGTVEIGSEDYRWEMRKGLYVQTSMRMKLVIPRVHIIPVLVPKD